MAQALTADGWRVVARNWRGGGGELDLVVTRGDQLRFVEVKVRPPEEALGDDAVPERKQQRLRQAAAAWSLEVGDWPGEQAFLVVYAHPEGDGWALRRLDDAFDG